MKESLKMQHIKSSTTRYILYIFLIFCATRIDLSTQYTKTTTPNGKNCKIPINSKQFYTSQWPLIYKPNGELYPTKIDAESHERYIEVNDDELVLLSCGPNYLKKFNRQTVLHAKCNGANGGFNTVTQSDIDKKTTTTTSSELQLKDLTCDLRVIEEILEPVVGCNDAKKLTATKFGYVDPTEQLTYILGEACYDENLGKTLFAHIKLGNKENNHLEKLAKNYLTTHRHPDGRYKIELFRGLHFDEIYERIRLQLNMKYAPHLQMAHYIDEQLLSNAQFQAVKKLGWNYYIATDGLNVLDELKRDIKHLSERLNLDVYVGSHGVKTLHGADGTHGKLMDIYIHPAAAKDDKNRFPMPELLWFVVKHQEQAMAFLIYNEATATNAIDENVNLVDVTKCQSDCAKITWLQETTKNYENSKALLCCTYEDFKKIIHEAPNLTEIKQKLI